MLQVHKHIHMHKKMHSYISIIINIYIYKYTLVYTVYNINVKMTWVVNLAAIYVVLFTILSEVWLNFKSVFKLKTWFLVLSEIYLTNFRSKVRRSSPGDSRANNIVCIRLMCSARIILFTEYIHIKRVALSYILYVHIKNNITSYDTSRLLYDIKIEMHIKYFFFYNICIHIIIRTSNWFYILLNITVIFNRLYLLVY